MSRIVVLVCAGSLVVTATGMAAEQATKLLGRSSTTRFYDGVSTSVYLRDDPEYKRDLARLRADLAEAQRELREAREAIAQVGELTPAQKKGQEEFLAPFVRAVKDAKAALAELATDFVKPFRSYGFRVQTSPSGQLVELEWAITCSRGALESERDGTITRRAPFEVWRPPTLPRAHSCYLREFVRRNPERGRMTATVLGRR